MNICLATVALVCMGAVVYAAGSDGLMRDPWCVLRVLGNVALAVVVPALLIGLPYLVLKRWWLTRFSTRAGQGGR
jgi:hypothetical protein